MCNTTQFHRFKLPRVLNRHEPELSLMSDKQLKIWAEDVRKTHPNFPFDSHIMERLDNAKWILL